MFHFWKTFVKGPVNYTASSCFSLTFWSISSAEHPVSLKDLDLLINIELFVGICFDSLSGWGSSLYRGNALYKHPQHGDDDGGDDDDDDDAGGDDDGSGDEDGGVHEDGNNDIELGYTHTIPSNTQRDDAFLVGKSHAFQDKPLRGFDEAWACWLNRWEIGMEEFRRILR